MKAASVLGAMAFAAVVTVALSVFFVVRGMYPELPDAALALVGRPEAEVYRALGPPAHVVDTAGVTGRELNEPWSGMNFRPYPKGVVSKKALLYSKGWTAAYVFIGLDGRVESVEVAGT